LLANKKVIVTGRRRNPVKTLFKVETLTPNGAIIIRAGSAMNTKKNMNQLTDELMKRNLGSVLILTLESLEDFQFLKEDQMNRLGWFKKEVANGSRPA
jgi:methionyl-tRNA formyltransferase